MVWFGDLVFDDFVGLGHHTVDGRNPVPPGIYQPQLVVRISEPSTVRLGKIDYSQIMWSFSRKLT